MAMRSAISRISPLCRSATAGVSSLRINRHFSDGKKVLSEEERAAENIYIQKMERERLEKAKNKAEKEKAEAEKAKGEKKMRTLVSSHRDTGRQKRDFRHLWITQINAVTRENKVLGWRETYCCSSHGLHDIRYNIHQGENSTDEEPLDPFSLVADELSLLADRLRSMVVAEIPKLASAAEYFF